MGYKWYPRICNFDLQKKNRYLSNERLLHPVHYKNIRFWMQRMSKKMYLSLMKRKIETRCPIYGPVDMIPGQHIASGQLTDPGVNFASVHGLMPVTVHMSFSLPRGNFERPVTRCTTPANLTSRGNFSPCEQNAKVSPGQEQSCACSLLMFGIYFPTKSSRNHQK